MRTVKYAIPLLALGLAALVFYSCAHQVETSGGSGALTSISLSSGTLVPSYSPSVMSYTAAVANSVASITVTAVGTGTIKINDLTVASGTASDPIALSIGSNTITVSITPTGSTVTETYTVTVTRANTGTTYYVSNSGNNSNSGTSEAQAWKELGFASQQLEAGDTLVILGGTYKMPSDDDDRFILVPQNSGTASAPILIRGESGNRPTLAGSDGLAVAVNLRGKSHITIENLEFTHDSSASNKNTGDIINNLGGSPSKNIVLQDLYIHDIGESGINLEDIDGLLIKNCQILRCGVFAVGGPGAGPGGGWKNVVIDNSDLSYSGHYKNPGAEDADRPDGFGIETSDGPIEIKNSRAEHNYGDGFDSKARDTYIHDCIVANNDCDGVKLWKGNSKVQNVLIYGNGDGLHTEAKYWAGLVIESDVPNDAFEVINVTIFDRYDRQNWPTHIQSMDDPDAVQVPVKVTMKNTIIAGGYEQAVVGGNVNAQVSFTCDNNLFYRPGSEYPIQVNGVDRKISELSSFGSNNLSADPKFVDPAWGSTGNYHLQTGSPALNTGTSSGAPAYDLEGTSRPQGSAVDMGAYEQ